jgi:hypothetical protein
MLCNVLCHVAVLFCYAALTLFHAPLRVRVAMRFVLLGLPGVVVLAGRVYASHLEQPVVAALIVDALRQEPVQQLHTGAPRVPHIAGCFIRRRGCRHMARTWFEPTIRLTEGRLFQATILH